MNLSTVQQFNAESSINKFDFVKNNTSEHLALTGTLYFYELNVGIFYTKCRLRNWVTTRATAFVLDIELKHYLKNFYKR